MANNRKDEFMFGFLLLMFVLWMTSEIFGPRKSYFSDFDFCKDKQMTLNREEKLTFVCVDKDGNLYRPYLKKYME